MATKQSTSGPKMVYRLVVWQIQGLPYTYSDMMAFHAGKTPKDWFGYATARAAKSHDIADPERISIIDWKVDPA